MRLGVVAPSSSVRDGRLQAALDLLEAAGYQTILGDHLYDRYGYLAGTDAARAADLNSMFARKDVDGILCARGGYGSWRVLDLVDWDTVRANPKVFIGYSDITLLHLAMERRANLVTFHGPMAITIGKGLDPSTFEQFLAVVSRPVPAGTLPWDGVGKLVGGRAAGPLAGGCLSLLAAAVGTPDAPDFRGCIVLLEDVGESLPHVDRHLCQLARSGCFRQAAGFVIGTVTGARQEGADGAITLEDLWQRYIVPLGKPAVWGFRFGHVENPLTLPLGCLAELDADAGRLSILEAAVV
ncbi:MAG: S66 peptidase family protein [Chthonomonadales bacterium]